MGDEEFITLKTLRGELITKACDLYEKLKKHESNKPKFVFELDPDDPQSTSNDIKKLGKHDRSICKISKSVSGVRFESIRRNLLRGNLYQYTTFVITGTLKFRVKLLVKMMGEEFEICDMNCSYKYIDKCYMLEINPWIQSIVKMKNLSLLTTVMYEYSERSVVRKTIIDYLKTENYAKSEPCTNNNGGILLYIHSPKNVELRLLKIKWSVVLSKRAWRIQHHFCINALDTGGNFGDQNVNLFKQFCKPNLSKQKVISLWNTLCGAIDSYQGKRKSILKTSKQYVPSVSKLHNIIAL